jgi:hypothetical protein
MRSFLFALAIIALYVLVVTRGHIPNHFPNLGIG